MTSSVVGVRGRIQAFGPRPEHAPADAVRVGRSPERKRDGTRAGTGEVTGVS
ncbi:hypothetical protein ACFW6E_37375 [Streptomyces olivaceoviridis]|uniref:hypothetical protein n=1 Tax=Streptomyces olivaceoviridis TaxID=1921 RepID=UPI0036B13BB0